MEKVFAIGFSKTGTSSLERALEVLDYKVCRGHWNNNYSNYLMSLHVHQGYEEILKFTRYFDAFADAPWGGSELYKELFKHYPNGKFILTTRDPEEWYLSLEKMLTAYDQHLERSLESFHENGRYGFVYFFQHEFGITSIKDKKDQVIKHFLQYNSNAEEYLKSKKADILVLNLTKDDGWDKLCGFLNKEIPQTEFPHKNKAKGNKHSLLTRGKRKLRKIFG